MPLLKGINVYPIKSCRGVGVDRVFVRRRGLDGDRQLAVVDIRGGALSQKARPRLALIRVRAIKDHWFLEAPGCTYVAVSRSPDRNDSPRKGADINVLGRVEKGTLLDLPPVDAWLTKHLGFPCRLARWEEPDSTVQTLEDLLSRQSFADAFPISVISSASLNALNERMKKPVPMNRFRPNLVVDDCEAFAEDQWKRVEIDGLVLHGMTRIERCVMITIDQEDATKSTEVSKRLLALHSEEGRVFFGRYFVAENEGWIETGMPVKVLEDQA